MLPQKFSAATTVIFVLDELVFAAGGVVAQPAAAIAVSATAAAIPSVVLVMSDGLLGVVHLMVGASDSK
jgi:hypothetical protein